MDLYVYVDDSLIVGDDAYVQLIISSSSIKFLCEDGEGLGTIDNTGVMRLNILVEDGFDGNNFTAKVKEDLQLCYNICHKGHGEVYLIRDGGSTIITEWFQYTQ